MLMENEKEEQGEFDPVVSNLKFFLDGDLHDGMIVVSLMDFGVSIELLPFESGVPIIS